MAVQSRRWQQSGAWTGRLDAHPMHPLARTRIRTRSEKQDADWRPRDICGRGLCMYCIFIGHIDSCPYLFLVSLVGPPLSEHLWCCCVLHSAFRVTLSFFTLFFCLLSRVAASQPHVMGLLQAHLMIAAAAFHCLEVLLAVVEFACCLSSTSILS